MGLDLNWGPTWAGGGLAPFQTRSRVDTNPGPNPGWPAWGGAGLGPQPGSGPDWPTRIQTRFEAQPDFGPGWGRPSPRPGSAPTRPRPGSGPTRVGSQPGLGLGRPTRSGAGLGTRPGLGLGHLRFSYGCMYILEFTT